MSKKHKKKIKKVTPHVKCVIPLAYGAELEPETDISIKKCIKESAKHGFSFEYAIVEGTSISIARNFGVNLGKSNERHQIVKGFDFLLSADRDMVFEPKDVSDAIQTMMKAQLYIFGNAYKNRIKPELYNCGYWYKEVGRTNFSRYLKAIFKGFNKVDWIGSGFLFIHRIAFNVMSFPWWREGHHYYEEDDVEYGNIQTDDIGFGINAFESGYNIYTDCDNPVRHLSAEKVEKKLIEKQQEKLKQFPTKEGKE
jgi:hypothetical protein